MKGKVNCTCGWSWNKSDSSKKDMYICHECGRDNSNNMKNGGWLDSYADGGTMQEHQENYNNSQASAPEGMIGDGFSNVGRNYSPAWGGQFQNGGPVKPSQKNYKTQGQYKAALREYELNLRKYELNNNPEKLKGESDKDYENRTKYFKYKVRQQQDKDPVTREYLKIKDDQDADFNPVTKTLRQIFTSPVHVGYGIYNAANPKGLDKYKSRATKSNEDIDLGSSLLDARSLLNPFDYGMKAASLLKQAATRTAKEVAEDQGVDLMKQGNEYINNYQMGGSVYPVNYVPQAQEGETMFKKPSILQQEYIDPIYSYSERTKLYPGEEKAFKERPDVAGMAAEDNHVIINPYSPISKEMKDLVRTNETARLAMRSGYPRPDFELTPKQQEFFNTVQNGKPYSEDLQDIKETIAARVMTGDDSAQDYTKEQEMYADKLFDVLKKSKEYATGMSGMMKSKIGMGNAFEHPAIKRMSQAMPKTGMTPEGTGTHYMSSVDNYAVPELQDLGEEELTLVDPDSRSREAIRFNSPEEANYFAKNYKEVAPMSTTFRDLNSFQGGGSIPGAVGFTYARTKGIPSNGPYAKKTMASAQNGVDMYDNPLIARMVNNANIDRSYYDPRLNTMNMGSDYNMWRDEETGEPLTGDDLKYQQDKMLAHENYHAMQHKEGRDNYDIAHSTDNEQWARMQKRPEVMSTDAVWNNFYNRSAIENIQDYANKINEVPEARLINQQLLFDKVLDRERYDNPSNLEGEAKFYEDTGVKFQNGGEMRYYQNGLDWKPKGMKDGGWLDGYEKAQDGKKFKLKDERGLVMKPSESTSVKRKDFNIEQSKENKAYINAVAAQKKEAARRAKLTKDQREREDYNTYAQEHGNITKSVPETAWERTKAIVSNPMTAIGYKMRGENLPGRFQFGPRNEHDYALDWINPLQGAVALSEIPGELGRGEFLNAGLSGLDALDLGVYTRGAKKALKPVVNKGINQLGNINPKGKIFSGMNNELNNMAIKNTEKYMAKRTPNRSPLSPEMEPYVSRYTKLSEEPYIPYQEDDYIKWFNEQKAKMNPSTPVQDPRSILRNSSVIDINDMKQGGIIRDDLGQWAHPGEITEINSNDITMEGVPYDVLGISDTGDTKLMKPGKNYKFKGKKVTEFPMAKNGLRQEQKGLVNLDNLLNFTNYNKPQPGGWLDSYK